MISLLTALAGAEDTYVPTPVAGYTPASDVRAHGMIDLDQKEMDTACDDANWDAAIKIYSEGKNSLKTSSTRTIQGFSTAMKEGRPKLRGEPYYDMYAEYWKSHTYADDLVMAALTGTGSYSGKSDIMRGEVANKGAQYIVTWQYVVHEMEDSRMDCENDAEFENDRGVKAWDETWLFWTGSMESGGCDDGMLGYQLAQKRCQNYGTCDSETCSAKSNENMLALMKGPQAGCEAGPKRTHVDCIVKEMTIPLIQGANRYAYKCSKKSPSVDGDDFYKAWGEGWAFLAAVLPQIDRCDKCAAAVLRENLDAGVPETLVMKDGYKVFRDALRSTFDCLGITCEDIGELAEASDEDGESACGDETSPSCPLWTVAGYVAATKVVDHAMIDVDHQVIDAKSDEYDWPAVKEIYTNGAHSSKSTSMRTIQGFSTATKDGEPKLKGEPYYDVHAAYWSSSTYADDLVMAALDATGDYADKKDMFRAEVVNKGAQYMVTWMYVIHEMEDARMDCEVGDVTQNDRGVHAWDEAWVFYAGSLEGVDGCDSGYSSYQLAQKRCKNFGTCHYSQKCDYAASNSAMLDIFNDVRVRGCPVRADIDEVVRLMVIPLLQGSIRYAYKLSTQDDRTTDKFAKEWGEGWAFLAAVIPHIDACDSDAAAMLRANMGPSTAVDDVMKDGYEKYRDAIRSTFKCLKITCTDIGELDSAVDGGVASESTCTCSNYSGCTAPDAGPGRWWTIKAASGYDGLVKPAAGTCAAVIASDDADDADDDSTSFAGVLSILLVAATM